MTNPLGPILEAYALTRDAFKVIRRTYLKTVVAETRERVLGIQEIARGFVDNRDVDASSIRVETLNGTVMLSGFAKNGNERTTAESIARATTGVRSVKNEISVRQNEQEVDFRATHSIYNFFIIFG